MPREREYTEFEDVKAIRATDLALLCEIDGTETWIPKSQISDESQVREPHDVGSLYVTTWFAEKEGLV